MKKALVTLFSLALASTIAVAGDGSVNFSNKAGSGASAVDAPVRDTDGALLTGSGFMAQLYAAAPGGTLQKIGAAVAFGTNPGYFSGSTRIITGLADDGGSADIQVRAWKVSSGADWESATIRGQSNLLANFDTNNPNNDPPDSPKNLIGLQAFNLQAVPEPTTLALGAAAAAGLLFRRRKSQA